MTWAVKQHPGQHRGKGQGVPGPAKPPDGDHRYITPVFQGQVEGLKDEPGGNGPEKQLEKLPGLIEEPGMIPEAA